MKNGIRYITIALLIVLMAVGAMSLDAKEKAKDKNEQVQLYLNSREDATKFIKDVAKSYSKGDKEKQSLYDTVLAVAFDRYWTLPEALAPVGPNTIEELNEHAQKITEILNNQADTQIELDSLRNLVQTYLALKDTIKIKEARLKSLGDEIKDIDNQIAQNNSKLDDFQTQADVVANKEKELTLVLTNLSLAYKNAQSKNDFSAVNMAQIDRAIEDYHASRAAIQSVLKKNVDQIDKTVEELQNLKTLKDLVAQSENAMAGKYNPAENEKLLARFNELVKNPGPTNDQRTFVSSIMKSLQNQGKAVENFCSILDYLAKEFPCVPEEGDRSYLKLNEVIIAKVQEHNKTVGISGDLYDPHYVQLNTVLQQVVEDLAPGSKMPITKINTEEKYQGYLNSKVNSVK